jgi:hypothetical protein
MDRASQEQADTKVGPSEIWEVPFSSHALWFSVSDLSPRGTGTSQVYFPVPNPLDKTHMQCRGQAGHYQGWWWRLYWRIFGCSSWPSEEAAGLVGEYGITSALTLNVFSTSLLLGTGWWTLWVHKLDMVPALRKKIQISVLDSHLIFSSLPLLTSQGCWPGLRAHL